MLLIVGVAGLLGALVIGFTARSEYHMAASSIVWGIGCSAWYEVLLQLT